MGLEIKVGRDTIRNIVLLIVAFIAITAIAVQPNLSVSVQKHSPVGGVCGVTYKITNSGLGMAWAELFIQVREDILDRSAYPKISESVVYQQVSDEEIAKYGLVVVPGYKFIKIKTGYILPVWAFQMAQVGKSVEILFGNIPPGSDIYIEKSYIVFGNALSAVTGTFTVKEIPAVVFA